MTDQNGPDLAALREIARATLEIDDLTEHRSRETEIEERERVIAAVVSRLTQSAPLSDTDTK